MRFRICIVVAVAVAALAVLAPAASASPGTEPIQFPVVVTGGFQIQRERTYEVVQSCRVPVAWVSDRLGTLRIEVVSDIPDAHFRVAAIASPGLIRVKGTYDNRRPAEQRVSWSWGEDSPIFRDVICHEWAHQVFNALPMDAQTAWTRAHFQLPGYPHPCEAFAENFRLTMYPAELLWRNTTVSPYPMMSAYEMERWLDWAMSLGRFGAQELPAEQGAAD